MERFLDNLVKKPFQDIFERFEKCKKRKRKDFEIGEHEVSAILKKSSVYKRTHTSTQNFYPLDFSLQQDYQFKKPKLSLNESSFLNVPKESQVSVNFSSRVSKTKSITYYSQPGDNKYFKHLEETVIPQDLKLSKTPEKESSDESTSKNKILFNLFDKNQNWGMTSLENHAPFEKKAISIDAGVYKDEEENAKLDFKYSGSTKQLLDQFDTITKEISCISFDNSALNTEYEKEFEEKLTLSKLKKSNIYQPIERKAQNIDKDYQNLIGDILIEKVLDDKKNFPLITYEHYKKLKTVWEFKGNLTQNVAQHPHIAQILSYRNIQTLSGLSWLNDEVINAYISLLNQRDQEILHKKIYIFNTFFYQKLELTTKDKNLEPVFRITKRAKVNISECHKIFIPLNLNNNHWAFVYVDMINKKIIYNDSMGRTKTLDNILSNIKTYIEGIIKHEIELQSTLNSNGIQTFTTHMNKEYPQQNNCSDCGVFMLKGIDYVSRDLVPDFSPSDMPYFRLLITHELILGKILSI